MNSIPEPSPQPIGSIVPEALIDYITNQSGGLCQKEREIFVTLIKERDGYGRAKYGQPLMSGDGRNGIEDARQELGDFIQYAYKCKMAGNDLSELKKLIELANRLIKEF